jgi:hypothetical protein
MESFELLPHFVDDYLGFLYEIRPTAATFDGVHTHDDLLEDFARGQVERQRRDLGGFARRLAAIRADSLNEADRLDRAMLEADIRARLLDIEQVRSVERNPQLYADTLAASLAAQVLFQYAPMPERARRVASKLRQVPSLITAAKANIKEPPGLFVKTALETLRGLLTFLDVDLPRAFVALDDLSVLSDLADVSTEAHRAIAGYVEYLEQEVLPNTRASFRLGDALFAQKLQTEEGIGLDLPKLLEIAERELHATQEQFRAVAARIGAGVGAGGGAGRGAAAAGAKAGAKRKGKKKGDDEDVEVADAKDAAKSGGGKDDDAQAIWRRLKEDHPPAGALVREAATQVEALREFITRQNFVSLPDHEPLIVAPTPPFYRWTFASIWSPGPFETRPVRAYYYLTDIDPSWPEDRQRQHLRDFNQPTLWSISMHEAYPGHYLHFQHLKKVESRLRKCTLVAPTTVIEGWAHYAEQAMVEAGFGDGDPRIQLGQLAESLLRLARLIVSIRLHADDWSVEQGVRFFRDEAFLEEPSARREAERGTFDPSYGAYAIGKLALLKLRADYKAKQGKAFSLRAFHDAFLANGGLPMPLQRKALLGEEDGAVIE